MTYDTGEGLVIQFIAEYTEPEPTVGWVGGYDITIERIDRIDEDGAVCEVITERDQIKTMNRQINSLDWHHMEEIAKGNQSCSEAPLRR